MFKQGVVHTSVIVGYQGFFSGERGYVYLGGVHFHGAVIFGRRPPLISNILVAYEAHQGLVPSRSSYTDTDESVLMLTFNS